MFFFHFAEHNQALRFSVEQVSSQNVLFMGFINGNMRNKKQSLLMSKS